MEIRVDPQQLRRTLEVIVGERSFSSQPLHLAAVESFIEKELGSYGLKVENDYFSYRGKTFRNIIGRQDDQRGGSLIILGAHFDSVQGTPGADDNASGVAVLLEAARLLARARVGSQILFCAFNLEELNMIGSSYFVKKLKSVGAKVAAMRSLEIVGYTDSRPGSQKYPFGLKAFYPDRGDFIGVIELNPSTAHSARQMRQCEGFRSTLRARQGGLIPAVRLSDHAPFLGRRLSSTHDYRHIFFRNPHYHVHGYFRDFESRLYGEGL
jgi:hypothetical protein